MITLDEMIAGDTPEHGTAIRHLAVSRSCTRIIKISKHPTAIPIFTNGQMITDKCIGVPASQRDCLISIEGGEVVSDERRGLNVLNRRWRAENAEAQ